MGGLGNQKHIRWRRETGDHISILTMLSNCLTCLAANQTGKDFGMTFDKHIPMPALGKESDTYPDFKAMAVGDSAFFPNEGSILRCRAYLYVKSIEKRSKRYRYAGRSVIENGVAGVRIWRTA